MVLFQGSGEAVTIRVRRNTMSQSRAAYMREYRARRSVIRSEGGLLPFQSSFVAAISRKKTPLRSRRRAGHADRASRGSAAVWWRGL